MNQAILDKIRKLRALATSDNVNEAAAAAAAAERLIQEHNLSEAALDVGEGDEEVGDEPIGDASRLIPTWSNNLIQHLCRAYQCSGIYEWQSGGQDNRAASGYRFKAYGRPEDLGTLRYQFAFFSTEITRLAARLTKGRGRTYANSFRLGAVQAIVDAIGGAVRASRASATSTALVVVDRRAELAKERRDTFHPDIRPSKGGRSRIDPFAFAHGRKAGASINQRSQLAASGARMLGKGGS